MENIELNLYAPPSNINEMKEVYEKASEVVSLLDKQCVIISKLIPNASY